jgi:hypothetical protein
MATNDLVRYQDAAVPLTAAAAEQADNYSAQTALYATHKRIYDLQEGLSAVSLDGKKGNTILFTRTAANGGEYADLQAAVNDAVAGDVVLVGAGSWGPVTLKAGVSLMGLQPPLADEVVLSKLTFAPTSGTASANTVYVSNLRISSSANESLLVLGHASFPVSGVRVYRNNAAATTPLVSCIGDVASTSIYMKDCLFGHEGGQVANNITLLSSSARYLDLVACQFNAGGRCLDVTAGLTAASLCRFETASAISALRVASGATLTMGNSFIRNLGTANPTGIELTGGTCAASDCVFDIAPGTGRAIQGSGTLVRNNLVAGPGTNHVIGGLTPINFTALST